MQRAGRISFSLASSEGRRISMNENRRARAKTGGAHASSLPARLLALVAAIGLGASGPVWAENEGFISVEGTAFVLDGRPFHYVGTNNYYLMISAASEEYRGYVDEVLEDAASMGLKVIRTWAFNDGSSEWNALQTRPGVYRERVFRGLDYVLKKADEAGIRLILPFVNNWDDYGGMNQYVAWDAVYGDGTAASHDDFYTDSDTRSWYKDHVAAMLERVNVFTALAIGRIGTRRLTRFLPRFLTDPSPVVRLAAAKAVFQLASRPQPGEKLPI